MKRCDLCGDCQAVLYDPMSASTDDASFVRRCQRTSRAALARPKATDAASFNQGTVFIGGF